MTHFDADHFCTPTPYGFVEFTPPEEVAEDLKGELKRVLTGQHMLEILKAEEREEFEPGAIVLPPQADSEETITHGTKPAYFIKENVTPADVIAMLSKSIYPDSDTTL